MRSFIAILLATLGCSEPSPGDSNVPFTFDVEIGLYSDVTAVRVDGESRPVVAGEGFVFSAAFDTYDEALDSPPIVFEFLVGDQVQNVGESVPGVCDRSCVPGCPAPDQLIKEIVRLTQRDFAAYDYDGYTCVGTEGSVVGWH